MTNREKQPSLFSQVDVSATAPNPGAVGGSGDQVTLLHQIVSLISRQNEILEELVTQANAPQRQRAAELNQWKQANPALSQACRQAYGTLSKVQASYLTQLTEEIFEHGESLSDGEFLLTEFVDRFGPRLAHLNGMLQVLSQLAAPNQS